MIERKYYVLDESTIIARGMTLSDALLFIRALIEERYNEPFIELTIRKEPEEEK